MRWRTWVLGRLKPLRVQHKGGNSPNWVFWGVGYTINTPKNVLQASVAEFCRV